MKTFTKNVNMNIKKKNKLIKKIQQWTSESKEVINFKDRHNQELDLIEK